MIEENCLTEDNREILMYGLRCINTENNDIEIYNSLSSDKNSINILIQNCIAGDVSLTTLRDIIDDFVAEP